MDASDMLFLTPSEEKKEREKERERVIVQNKQKREPSVFERDKQ